MFKHWATYTHEVLAWAMDGINPPMPLTSQPSNEALKIAARLMEQARRRDAKWFILLGCDANALHLALSQELDQGKNPAQILIIESDTNKARAFINSYTPLPANVHMLTDTSPWALYLLTLEHLNNELAPLNSSTAIIHWSMPPSERPQVLSTWRKLFLGAKIMNLSSAPSASFKLSVGAIIHPEEAHLAEFFAHIPEWVHEIVIIWDALQVPDIAHEYAPKAKHFARPLANDFAAQRNEMLKNCTGNWLFYLDADERLSPQGFEQLSCIANMHTDLAGVYIPRLTFEGDDEHMRMAHGLWPDLQLRFFPLQNNVNFVGTVHEQVHGLSGSFFLAPHLALMHYSHIYKNEAELRQRLAVFNAAGRVEHKLSKAYPRLHKDFFEIWTTQKPHLLQLPN